MRSFLPCLLLIAAAGVTQAGIVEAINIDLSTLHAGSTLSGTFILPDTPLVGDTAPVTLNFSDPSDYSTASLAATISIGNGTIGDTVVFSALTFTNPSGNSFLKNVDLTVAGAAQCTTFPCTANGRFEDGSPAAFTGTYSISPSSVPEPGYGVILLLSLAALIFYKRLA